MILVPVATENCPQILVCACRPRAAHLYKGQCHETYVRPLFHLVQHWAPYDKKLERFRGMLRICKDIREIHESQRSLTIRGHGVGVVLD